MGTLAIGADELTTDVGYIPENHVTYASAVDRTFRVQTQKKHFEGYEKCVYC